MHMLRIAAILVLSSGTPVLGEQPKPDGVLGADLKLLQGKWKAVKAIKEGNDEDLSKEGFELSIVKSTAEIVSGGKVVARWALTVDPKASPKAIDIEFLDDKEARAVERFAKGIYEIKGDQLKMCISITEITKERPKTFEVGKKVTVIELERIKK